MLILAVGCIIKYTLSNIAHNQRELMENSVEKQQTKRWVSDAIIIAASSIVAYMAAFLYEVGFDSVFGIPVEFINLNLTTVCTVGTAWLVIIVMIYFVGELMFQLWPKGANVHPVYSKLSDFIPSFIIVIVLLFLYDFKWKEWIATGAFLLTFLLIDLISPLITQRGKKTYRDKLKANDGRLPRETFLGFAAERLGVSTIVIILLLVYGFWFSYHIGRSKAMTKNEFLVVATSPEMVVLRTYGDKLICAPFDRTTNEVKRTFSILKIAEDANLKLSLEKVGPLHMEKESSQK